MEDKKVAYLYYVEHENIESANVIAVKQGQDGKIQSSKKRGDICRVMAATSYEPNAPVHETMAPIDYLTGMYCRSVTEEEARRIHPILFVTLDKTGIQGD